MARNTRWLVLPLLFAAPLTLRAQRLDLKTFSLAGGGLVSVSASDDFPFATGWGVRMRIAVLELGYERLSGDRMGTAVTCAGLIPPGQDCSPERARFVADHKGMYVGVPLNWTRERARLSVIPEIGITKFDIDRIGQRSGRITGGEETYLSLGAGGRASWRPSPRWPVFLNTALFGRAQLGDTVEHCADCGPRVGGLNILTLTLGLELLLN